MLQRITQIIAQISIDEGDIDIPTNVDPDSGSIDTLLTLMFSVMGGIALLVIIIAGMQFVLSRGDAEKAAKARRTIIYAAVGLVIAVMAFTIVSFVVGSV